jgi:hypothetical protein
MGIFNTIGLSVQFLLEGIARIFSPVPDEYPNIGVQPFDGEPLSEWIGLSKH